MGRDIAMHLEVKRNVNLSPCREGFTGKDSCAFSLMGNNSDFLEE